MKKAAGKKGAGISDEAVQARTGKTWQQWFKILDAGGAKKMSHSEIATYLYEKHEVPGWWAQMVTVGYEQARGMREKHQKPSGYEISTSKTVVVPLSELFRAWEDKQALGRWLKDSGFTVRKATANKSMRITWVDGKTSLDVNFYPKGNGKSLVAVQHGKLADARAAERMKAYWGEQLDRLKAALET